MPPYDQTAQAIDEEVKRIVADCQARVEDILTRRRPALDALAKALMEKEVLNGEELDRLISGPGFAPAAV